MARGGEAPRLTIKVTAHQYWWQVEYQGGDAPSAWVTGANELYLPIGEPVRLQLTSADVIHSLWIPSLHGKRDLIPGRTAETWIQADRAGVFRGECAEFCGLEHARMALEVVAVTPAEHAAWLDRQREPARSPDSRQAMRGREVFMSQTCAMCHTVAGTPAGGTAGPDLTHVASRGTLAAGTIPNTRGHLAGWIADPHRIKPGARMPGNLMAPEDLQALVAYLEILE
jgi:cytochrome c oxidase subunit 2